MSMLAGIRRIQPPLICLGIACIFSVGCRSKQEVVSLGEPLQAFEADNGSVLLGYYVKPVIKPANAGWHWLVIEPETARLLMQAQPPAADGGRERVVTVSYKGWDANADLTPPLLEPGFTDAAPPVLGNGGMTVLGMEWDEDRGGLRFVIGDGEALPWLLVQPGSETLEVRIIDRDRLYDVLIVVAVGAFIAGLVLLGGSAEFSSH